MVERVHQLTDDAEEHRFMDQSTFSCSIIIIIAEFLRSILCIVHQVHFRCISKIDVIT